MKHGLLDVVDRNTAANEARMLRQDKSYHHSTVILVEGESDILATDSVFDDSCSVQVVANGKPEVLGALSILEETGFEGVVALVDSDFWNVDGEEHASSVNLIATDWHDWECYLIWSSAFGRVLNEEFDDRFKSRCKVVETQVQDVRSYLTRCARPVGLLLWITQRSKPQLPIRLRPDSLAYDQFIDVEQGTVDPRRLVESSRIPNLDGPTVDQIVPLLQEELSTCDQDDRQVCRGHDLTAVLALALRSKWGKESVRARNSSDIESMLRLAFHFEDFARTQMYELIVQWEQRNQGYRLLKRPQL